ncbi:MAG: hypothetical protein AAF193_01700 [Bacteroidota bacterium]
MRTVLTLAILLSTILCQGQWMSDSLLTAIDGKTIGIHNDQANFSELDIKKINGSIEKSVINLEGDESDYVILPGIMKSPTGQTSIGSFLFNSDQIEVSRLTSNKGYYVLNFDKHQPLACFIVGKSLMLRMPIKVQMKALLSLIENEEYELNRMTNGDKVIPHLPRFKKGMGKSTIGIPSTFLTNPDATDLSAFPNQNARVVDLEDRSSTLSNSDYLLLCISLPYELANQSFLVLVNTDTGECYAEPVEGGVFKREKIEPFVAELIGSALAKDSKSISLLN